MMFLERFFFLLDDTDSSGQLLMFSLNPQSCNNELQNGTLLRKISSLQELAVILFDTDLGICFSTNGG